MCACDLNAVKQLSTNDTLCLYYFTWRSRHPYVRASPYMCSFLFFFRRRRRQYDEGRKDITATGLG